MVSLAKWLTVCLRSKWLWVRVPLQSLIESITQENGQTNEELELDNAQEEGSPSDCNIEFSVSGSSSVPADIDISSNIGSLNRD